MSAHRYKIGQMVSLSLGFGYARGGLTVYRIVALLPQDRTHYHYRIRAESENFDRVAAENELTFHGEA
jgi:hypothetical protein